MDIQEEEKDMILRTYANEHFSSNNTKEKQQLETV